ncbi:MAG TPA: glycosyltransferase family 87 protein [Propionicimonas sp.]|nr:glycosyltransferase family 87 protein [Propionicimonas sp.]
MTEEAAVPTSRTSGDRWKLAAFAVLLAMVGYSLLYVLWTNGRIDGVAHTPAADFVAFYSASWQTLFGGGPLPVWDYQHLFTIQQQVAGVSRAVPWFYPPTFLLVVAPLALLPYGWAFALWLATTVTLWILVVRRAAGAPHSWLVVFGFPALWWAALDGQNSFLTAAIVGLAVIAWRTDRKVLAGVVVGLLVIKPHLAVGLAIVLVAARAWRTVVAAAATAISGLAVSVLVFGWLTVPAWLGSLSDASALVAEGQLPWQKMPSVYAMLRLLGVTHPAALAVHAVVALAVAVAVWQVGRRARDWRLLWAAGMIGGFLIVPYGYDYDLVWLLLPILWLAATRTTRWEKLLLGLAWVAPFGASMLADSPVHLQFACLVLGGLLWLVWRRLPASRPAATGDLGDSAVPAHGDQ